MSGLGSRFELTWTSVHDSVLPQRTSPPDPAVGDSVGKSLDLPVIPSDLNNSVTPRLEPASL